MMMMMSDSYLTGEYTEITDGSWIMGHGSLVTEQ